MNYEFSEEEIYGANAPIVRKTADIANELSDQIKKRKEITKLKNEYATLEKIEKARENELELELLRNLEIEGVRSVGTTQNQFTIRETQVPNVKNFGQVWEYMVREDAPHLISNKSLSPEACRELWGRGLEIPGVEIYNKVELSVTKPK